MKLFETIGIVYLIFAISVIIHEISHYIYARIKKIKVYNVCIGEEFLSIRICGLRISPLILCGYVEFDTQSVISKSKKEIIILFLSGSIANLILIIIASCLIPVFVYSLHVIAVNISAILFNTLPIKFIKNDMYELKNALKYK